MRCAQLEDADDHGVRQLAERRVARLARTPHADLWVQRERHVRIGRAHVQPLQLRLLGATLGAAAAALRRCW